MTARYFCSILAHGILLLGCFLGVNAASAQRGDQPLTGDQAVYRDGKVNIPLTDEYQVGVLFHTQGIGITARRGYYLNAFAVRNIGVDLAYFKHPKEIQTTNPIYENGSVIGRATGGDYGFRLGKSIALGMVKPELGNVGQKLKVEILGEKYDATILDESPYDPENKLLRA